MSIVNLGQKAYSATTFEDSPSIYLRPTERYVTDHLIDNEFVFQNSSQIDSPIDKTKTYYLSYDITTTTDSQNNLIPYFKAGDKFVVKLIDSNSGSFQCIGEITHPVGYIVFKPVENTAMQNIVFDKMWIQYKGSEHEPITNPLEHYQIKTIKAEEFKASHIGVRGLNGDVVVINGESIEIGRRDVFEIEMDVKTFAVVNLIANPSHQILVDYIISDSNSEEEEE